MPVVRIPSTLRALTGGREEMTVRGGTVSEALDDLERACPGMSARILDERGVRRFVNIYVGEDDIRFMRGLETPIASDDAITIVPALAGG